jgi:hypothetical protein
MTELIIPVYAGLCELRFSFGCSCGPDNDHNPGVGFNLITSHLPPMANAYGQFRVGAGVIGRKDAAELRDALEIFLKQSAQDGKP